MMLQQYNNYTTTTEATTTIKSTTNNNSSSAAAATTLTSTAAVLGSCFTGTGTQSGSSAQQFQHPHYYNSRMKYEEYSSSSSSLQGRPSLENGGCVKREAKCVKRETDQQQQQNTLLATPFVPSSIPLNGHRHYPQTYMGMGVMPTIPLANVFQQPSSSSQGPLGALEAMTEQQRLLTINDNKIQASNANDTFVASYYNYAMQYALSGMASATPVAGAQPSPPPQNHFNNNTKKNGRKTRKSYLKETTSRLEDTFMRSKYVNSQQREELKRQTGLEHEQIKVWFQNRRMKEKKKQKTGGMEKEQPSASASSSISDNCNTGTAQQQDESQTCTEMATQSYQSPLPMEGAQFWCSSAAAMYNSMATATYNPPAAMYPMMPMYGGYGDGSYEYSTGAYLQ